MHIRIGNDISFLISLSTLGVERIEDVKYAKGLFIALDQENIIHHPHNCHPQFYDSEYNIHDCGMLNYNAFPINANINHKHHHNHEFCVYEDCSSPVRTNENKDSLILLFPGKAQRYCGRYRVELELMLSDSKIRNVKINFGEQFTLVNDGSGQSGDITISLGNTGLDTDIYAKSATVEYLQNMNGQWSQFMLSSDKYIYDYIPKKTITVSVKENNSKVAIISKYDDLYFTYNSFCFPVSRTNIGDYYLYVSSYYFDKQDISIQISRVKNVEYPDIDFDITGESSKNNIIKISLYSDYSDKKYVQKTSTNLIDVFVTTENPVYSEKDCIEISPKLIYNDDEDYKNELKECRYTSGDTKVHYIYQYKHIAGNYTLIYNKEASLSFIVNPIKDTSMILEVSVNVNKTITSRPELSTNNVAYLSNNPISIYARSLCTDLKDLLASGPYLGFKLSNTVTAPYIVKHIGAGIYEFEYSSIQAYSPDDDNIEYYIPGDYIVKYGQNMQNTYDFTILEDTTILDNKKLITNHSILDNSMLITYGIIADNKLEL